MDIARQFRNMPCSVILEATGLAGLWRPYNLSEKYWQYTSNLYRSTPLICNAVPRWLQSFGDRETPQYTSNLYRSTPPICTAVRLPFVPAILLRKYQGLGVSESSWDLSVYWPLDMLPTGPLNEGGGGMKAAPPSRAVCYLPIPCGECISRESRSHVITRARHNPEPRSEVWWWNLRWSFGGKCFWRLSPAKEARKPPSKLHRKFATNFAKNFANFTLEIAGAYITKELYNHRCHCFYTYVTGNTNTPSGSEQAVWVRLFCITVPTKVITQLNYLEVQICIWNLKINCLDFSNSDGLFSKFSL